MNEHEPELLRVRRIQVDGLFGLYKHCIDLNLDERVTILHGPNGVGKTVTLRMVNALLGGRFEILGRMPFSRFSLEFSDGSLLILSPKHQSSNIPGQRILHLVLQNEGQKYETDISEEQSITLLAQDVARRLGWLMPLGENLWLDQRNGEELSTDAVLKRYADHVPKGRKKTIKQEPFWHAKFRAKVHIHLIETQRLIRVAPQNPYRYRVDTITSTVVEYSNDLKQRIKETLARYGQQSQNLDQSFPQRLLTAPVDLPQADELKERMKQLDNKRSELREIGLLDETITHPFDLSRLDQLDPIQKKVMSLYVQDTEQKLGVLDDLARRANRLMKNINQKFSNKHIKIDREKGFVAVGEDGRPLDMDSLSSGEQHEIVLHYDLLFRVRPNTLVLIDEPELSLHVAWQKKFLPDLLKIVQIAGIDVLIATHSPYIVNDRSDLMVALETGKSDA